MLLSRISLLANLIVAAGVAVAVLVALIAVVLAGREVVDEVEVELGAEVVMLTGAEVVELLTGADELVLRLLLVVLTFNGNVLLLVLLLSRVEEVVLAVDEVVVG